MGRRWYMVFCLIILSSLTACTDRRPIEVEVGCNQCLDTLTISLEGAVPQDYELNLVFPAGEVAGVHCVDGQAEENWVYGMPVRDNIVTCINDHGLYIGPPSSFTVTLTWDDNQIVQHYEPTYEAYYHCGGRCYAGSISVTIPIDP